MADTGTWHLVQFTPDLKRHEPRNVGVALLADNGWIGQFLAESAPGEVDGRRTPGWLPTSPYWAWVHYFRRKMADDAWADIERATSSRPGNFSITEGGRIVAEEADWAAELNGLFASLVSTGPLVAASVSAADELKMRAGEVLRLANVVPDANVEVDVRFGDVLARETFDFGYQNGTYHLMKAVALNGSRGRERALSFYAQATAAKDAGSGSDFLAFYDGEVAPSDKTLAPLEGIAHVVDVSKEDQAVSTIVEVMGH